MLTEIRADALEPLELERILLGSNFKTLGHVSIQDRNSTDDRLEDAIVLNIISRQKAVQYVLRRFTR